MKRILAVALALVLMCAAALAEVRTIDLETITVAELETLKKDLDAAILNATVENIDGCNVVADYAEYARNPEAHIGERIRFNGKIIQVVEGSPTIYRVAMDGNSDNVFYASYTAADGAKRVLEDDMVTVFATGDGLYTYQRTFGGSITIPFCTADKITDQEEEKKYPATRQETAPIGATARCDGSSYSNKCVTDLTITNVIRGDAANKLVRSWYHWNNDNDSTHDYIVVYVRTDAISSENDTQASIDGCLSG